LELREHIIEEADKLFCQYGIKSVTMDDIARHLGMSKKTIYLHFEDKNELVNILIRNKMETQVGLMDKSLAESSNAVDEIFKSVTQVQYMLSNMNPVLFYDLQKYYPQAWMIFKNFRESSLLQFIKHNLGWGLKEGYYRKEINIEILSRMRIEQIDMAFNQTLPHVNKYSVADVMKELTQHYLYGICTIKGLKLIEKYKNTTEELNINAN
jgi:AcrR family transcriptional regulator